ncbi:helix-turn-helix domain-containing protein [Actinomycetospora endophytica]|uniref:Helix-turn-helix domain-containing protein n=1 Tax=Actinomycetospora endophytica TaxID=2291215 RepID=A0ABS8PBR5_9PSEU|nr:GAF domain-containing protein [Actinomycetospora endophytica]MCD2195720.1 helix-turn-helix domain-containing protein [Actinomycetospora endophytica]
MGEAQLTPREELARSREVRPDHLPRRLLASWHRSAGYGVSLDAVSPAYAGGVDDESLFYESGQQVLRDLHQTLADEPVSLMLTDVDGLVLNRVCGDRFLLDALDSVYLAPGFDYSERETGTTGLGLALADRVPTLVRAEEHYCTRLWGYTCAAVPVEDPITGELVGSVNLTTWSQQSYNLLLALAQTAARGTEALMLARSQGRTPRPANRGRVFRVQTALRGDGAHGVSTLGPEWRSAFEAARAAVAEGQGVAVIGEAGTGKSALLSGVYADTHPGRRVLDARAPEPQDVGSWLSLWSPELGKADTSVIIGRVDALPAYAAGELVDQWSAQGSPGSSVSLTARGLEAVPPAMTGLVGRVVELPPLRHRSDDVMPLARRFAREVRGREVRFTAAAEHTLVTYHWPGNVTQLRDVVRHATTRADVVAERDLPPEVFTGSLHKLTRMESLERDEIVRCLSEPGATAADAAAELGMSRSTIYRRIARYGIRLPAGAD